MYMSKYEHEADLTKIEVCKNLTGFLRSIQFALASGYRYYVTGQISYNKVISVMNKFDEMYRICESSIDRTRRHKLDQAVVTIKLFFPLGGSSENDIFHYILLAKPGINNSKKSMDHRFFERENYSDAHNKLNTISIDHYYFTRVNKEAYKGVTASGKNIKTDPAVGVWTCRVSKKYIQDTKFEFKVALLQRNWHLANVIMKRQTNLIPFYGVRRDYLTLRRFFYKTINEFIDSDSNCSSTTKNKIKRGIYEMKESLAVMGGIKTFRILLSELLNNKLLKQKI